MATRQLTLAGASPSQIRPASRLLIFCSLVTLALNTAQPIIEGHYGRAAFDAVGCCLLIGWSHIAPDLLGSLQTARPRPNAVDLPSPPQLASPSAVPGSRNDTQTPLVPTQRPRPSAASGPRRRDARNADPDLVHRARLEDTRHWETHLRPISAETIRKQLHVGSSTARDLVAQLRNDSRVHPPGRPDESEPLATAM